MTIKTEEIIFCTKKAKELSNKPQTVCEIFNYQPDNIEQIDLGGLFIVSELNGVKDCGHLNNLLASLIKREYYLYPKNGAHKCFQSSLKKANHHLSALAKEGNLEWLGNLHFICVSIAGQDLFFSQTGNCRAFLWREDHLMDLGKKVIPEPEKPKPTKIFSSIVAGKVENGDKIILSTPGFEELISPQGLRQILIQTPDLAGANDQINRILREQKKTIPLSVLMLDVRPEDPPREKLAATGPKIFITAPIDLHEIIG